MFAKYRTVKGAHGADMTEVLWEGTEKEICFKGDDQSRREEIFL